MIIRIITWILGVVLAKAYAEGIGNMRLPTIMSGGTASSGGPAAAIETFFQIKNAAEAMALGTNDNSPSNTERYAPRIR